MQREKKNYMASEYLLSTAVIDNCIEKIDHITLFKMSLFVLHWGQSVIQVLNNMKVNKSWQIFHLSWVHSIIIITTCLIVATNGGVGATCRRLCSISEILYDLLGMCVCVSLSLNPTCFPLFPFLLFPLSAWGGGRWMCEKQEICFCPCQFCSTEHW